MLTAEGLVDEVQGVAPEREIDLGWAAEHHNPVEPHHEQFAAPSKAEERPRRWFDPAKGWLRRTERKVSHLMSSHVFNRIPGMRVPYSRQLERELTLTECQVAIPRLPEVFQGMQILLITDLHAGPFVSSGALADACRRLMACDPDMVLLGGDLLTGDMSEFSAIEPALDELAAPHGVWAVLGNHDHYAESPLRMRRLLQERCIEVLHNRSVQIQRGGESITLAGIDDYLVGDHDLATALEGAHDPVILLSHNPDVFFDAAQAGVALTLSGHTHAGQIRIPGLGVIVRQSRYRLDEGRYRYRESELLVSRGLGAVGLPFRLHCSPEGVLVTLTAESDAGIRKLQQV